MNTDKPLIDVLGQYRPNIREDKKDDSLEYIYTLHNKSDQLKMLLKQINKEKEIYYNNIVKQLQTKYEANWRIKKRYYRGMIELNLHNDLINIEIDLFGSLKSKYRIIIEGKFNNRGYYQDYYINDYIKTYNLMIYLLDKLNDVDSGNINNYMLPELSTGRYKLIILFKDEIENMIH